ncbi:chromosome partitioning protein, ParB family [Agromyces cerinus subsp. cerinus]|uniref:Chromosome partitioning protein, ParB family n=2 Tax=Agromyces cerinus TaxID=33878 RepID=A0A1N6IEL6_9MICO|nr:chromosome partitioning protein, ParB family [Agromyces cerinus subsp. cerinus]
MTTTTTTTAAQAQVEHIDPQTLVLEENVRQHRVELDEGFLDSIRASGVLTPVSGRRADDGTVYVRYGQRRVLAAREVGLETIPVYMNATEGTVTERIVSQYVENERRAEMTDADRVDALRLLELDGMSAAKIAKATGTKKDTVAASLKIAASETARAAIATDVTFDVALALVEFEGDAEACEAILDAREGDLAWITQRLRDDRARTRIWEAAAAEEAAKGYPVIGRDSNDYESLYGLTDAPAEAEERPEVDPEQHTGCPGHAVRIHVQHVAQELVAVTAVCTRADLHHPRWSRNDQKVDISTLPEEEQEAAREAARAERRRLIENNKSWDAAETVRREWLVTLLSRKTLPKDAAAFVAVTLARHSYEASASPSEFAGELLGFSGYDMKAQISGLVESQPAKAGHVNLALTLAARENHTSREAWRTPNATDTAYLLRLEAWGHHLAPVERIAAGYPEAADDTQD